MKREEGQATELRLSVLSSSSSPHGWKQLSSGGRREAKISRRVLAQVLDTPRQVADHPKQDVHRRSLNVPPRFPPGHCVRSQPEQTRQVACVRLNRSRIARIWSAESKPWFL